MSLVKGVDGVKAPATFMLHGLRPTFQRLVNARWQIELHGEDKVPTSGPVILAANHIGLLDGPLLAIVSPRPAHVMTKREMFTGPMSAFLVGSGQIPLNREGVDVEAILGAQLVLTRGGAVGIFPEGERGQVMCTQPRGRCLPRIAQWCADSPGGLARHSSPR